MQVLIINQPLCNRGDESAHRALVRSIIKAKPDVRITVLFDTYTEEQIDAFQVMSPQVEYVLIRIPRPYSILNRIYHKLRNLVLRKSYMRWTWFVEPTLRKIRYYYVNADLVLNAPGGICMGGFQNWHHIEGLRIAKLFKRPIIYYGRSFGPFPTETESNRLFKQYSLEMLRYFSFLSIRDKKTEHLAIELGIPYESTLDSAFLEQPYVEIPKEVKELIAGKPYMVFVPNILIWHYAYKDKLTKQQIISFYSEMAEIMLQAHNECNIIMLPQTFMFGDYENDDVCLFHDIAKNMNNERIIVLPDTYSSDLQQTLISDATLLVGARYHSIVFAINNNVPFVALSYEHKIEGLLEALDKKDCMIDISSVSTEQGRSEINKSVKYLLPLISKDEKATKKAKAVAMNCFSKFVSRFLTE